MQMNQPLRSAPLETLLICHSQKLCIDLRGGIWSYRDGVACMITIQQVGIPWSTLSKIGELPSIGSQSCRHREIERVHSKDT